MLNALKRTSQRAQVVRSLYAALILRSRQPIFFAKFGVADSIDGRFDMVALHAWLALERLQAAGLADIARAFSKRIFIGFDEALRDLGAGDMGMGSKMKKLGDAFNGRLHAYNASHGEGELSAAILRNVYRGDDGRADDAQSLARYALGARIALATCEPLRGELEFGALPVPRG